MKMLGLYLFFLIVITSANAEIFIFEDFKAMDNWKDLIFPKIENKTDYSIEEGKEKLGTWQTYRVNILEDYRKIFNSDPLESE